ncbi:hypothetical protein VPHK45_0010 [Vibrio phage K45]
MSDAPHTFSFGCSALHYIIPPSAISPKNQAFRSYLHPTRSCLSYP